jgi:hypothetical protein
VPITDPTDIAGCILWLAADDIVGLSDGDPVSTWADGSGAGRDATGSGGSRPTYQTGELNGRPVVRFDGTDDEMATASVGVTDLDCTIIAVLSPANTDAGRSPVFVGNDGGGNGYGIATSTGGGAPNEIGRLRGGIAWDSTGTAATTGPAIYSLVQSSGSCEVFLDGVSLGTFSSDPNNPTSRITLGNHRVGVSSANCWAGDIAEIAIYDSPLDATDRGDVEAYLTAKWFGGGATDTPLDAQPGTLTLAGASATFAIGFAGSPGTLTLTGSAAGFDCGFAGSPGSLTISGQAATFALTLVASPGALTLTGFAATLVDSGAAEAVPGGVFRRTLRTWSRTIARQPVTLDRTFSRSRPTLKRVWRYDPMALATESGEALIAAESDDREYGFDCSHAPELATGTGITISSGAILGGSGLSFGTPTVLAADFDDIPSGKGLSVRIYDGDAGTTYKLAMRVTLSNTRTFVVPGRLKKVADYDT